MNLVEAKTAVSKERERLKREGASDLLLLKLERVARDLANTINDVKREGFNPDAWV